MRALVFLALVLVASASVVEVQTGYHAEVGIPLAERIRVYEEGLLSKNSDTEGERIVGGSLAPTDAYPFFVSVSYFLLCTGCNNNCCVFLETLKHNCIFMPL